MTDNRTLAGTRVLLIDDSATIRKSAELHLTRAQCELFLAEDGFEGLARLADCRPDLIFCDIMMPRLDGWKTCAIIKRHPLYQRIPVVMLSSRDGVFDLARARLCGADTHLAKPFSGPSLLDLAARLAKPV